MKYFTALFIIFSGVFSMLANCLEFTNSLIIKDKGLENVVKIYYELESNKNWEKTFNLRSGKYRELVGYSLYSKKMISSSIGWELRTIEILDVEKLDDSTIEINIRFFSKRNGFNHVFTEVTTWANEEGGWLVIKPGIRGRFYLNDWLIK